MQFKENDRVKLTTDFIHHTRVHWLPKLDPKKLGEWLREMNTRRGTVIEIIPKGADSPECERALVMWDNKDEPKRVPTRKLMLESEKREDHE